MNVFDNVAFAMRVTGASKREVRKRVPYILGLVGLQNKARCFPQELSGGEQQRVSLARALVNNPSLIIADEPTGNIDPEMSYEIMELLTEINRRGTTILVVTHEHDLVQAFKRRVIVIDGGTVVSDVPQDDEYETPAPAANGVVADVLDTIQEPAAPAADPVDAVLADFASDYQANGGDAQ